MKVAIQSSVLNSISNRVIISNSSARLFSSRSVRLNQNQNQSNPQPAQPTQSQPSTSSQPTNSNSNSSSFFNPPPPKSQRPTKPPLLSLDPSSASYRHRSFYSEILPPFLRVLAYGSASYFALHLTWSLLNDSQLKEDREKELDQLQETVRRNREKVLLLREGKSVDENGNQVAQGNQNGKSWWKFW